MMQSKVFRGIMVGILVLAWLGVSTAPAAASTSINADTRLGTIIKLNPIDPVGLGEAITLQGVITTLNGQPVVDKSIIFSIDGIYLGQAPSNAQGFFERKIKNNFDAGKYLITATSNESRLLTASKASISIKINPAQVIVQTVPAILGVAFQMDGRKFFSNQEGLARIEISRPGEYRLQVLAEEYANPNQKIEFSRWTEEVFEPSLNIQVPARKVIQVGLNVSHLHGVSFVDMEGLSVDKERISDLTIRSLQGDVLDWKEGEDRWIPASRVARRLSGLEETKLYYSVSSVVMDGSNVVNQSQQRFYSSPGGKWTISLILYSLKVNARDSLLGSPAGKTLNLEYPDGKVESIALDSSGQVTLHSLARGPYYIKIEGVKGISNRVPVALSKDQDVSVRIITSLDLAIFGTLAVLLALGLLIYGRPWLLQSIVKQSIRLKELTVQKLPRVEVPQFDPITYLYSDRSSTVNPLQAEKNGVSDEVFEEMLRKLEGKMPKIGRPSKLTLKDQLQIAVLYIHQNDSVAELSQRFHVSETTVRRTIQKNTALFIGDEKIIQVKSTDEATSLILVGKTSTAIGDSAVEGGIS